MTNALRRALPALLACLLLAACGNTQPPPRSQFGEYAGRYKRLTLVNGDTFTVYRVKTWIFSDGPPALRLEFEPGFEVADTVRLRRLADRIWPAFAPYVEGRKLSVAILTATNLKRRGIAIANTTSMSHFGLVATRDSSGTWMLNGQPLPPAEAPGRA
ncbi:MAG TPA: hypothetical protein VF665_11645, partial [Longimicrobium sp.]|uniref:hypothetical protein n=1 Tax=Longimicrobium sp. TaxID=2029185 RepID=UPI002EDB5878